MSHKRRPLREILPATYLLDYRQILGRVDAERFHAYTIPVVVTLPNIREPSGSECNVTLFRDVAQ